MEENDKNNKVSNGAVPEEEQPCTPPMVDEETIETVNYGMSFFDKVKAFSLAAVIMAVGSAATLATLYFTEPKLDHKVEKIGAKEYVVSANQKLPIDISSGMIQVGDLAYRMTGVKQDITVSEQRDQDLSDLVKFAISKANGLDNESHEEMYKLVEEMIKTNPEVANRFLKTLGQLTLDQYSADNVEDLLDKAKLMISASPEIQNEFLSLITQETGMQLSEYSDENLGNMSRSMLKRIKQDKALANAVLTRSLENLTLDQYSDKNLVNMSGLMLEKLKQDPEYASTFLAGSLESMTSDQYPDQIKETLITRFYELAEQDPTVFEKSGEKFKDYAKSQLPELYIENGKKKVEKVIDSVKKIPEKCREFFDTSEQMESSLQQQPLTSEAEMTTEAYSEEQQLTTEAQAQMTQEAYSTEPKVTEVYEPKSKKESFDAFDFLKGKLFGGQ